MGGQFIIVHGRQFSKDFFETRRAFKIYQGATFYTDKMVVMLFERVCELVTLLEPYLHDINDAEFRKKLQRAVDACTLGELAGA
jgi:hypothetical protein